MSTPKHTAEQFASDANQLFVCKLEAKCGWYRTLAQGIVMKLNKKPARIQEIALEASEWNFRRVRPLGVPESMKSVRNRLHAELTDLHVTN